MNRSLLYVDSHGTLRQLDGFDWGWPVWGVCEKDDERYFILNTTGATR